MNTTSRRYAAVTCSLLFVAACGGGTQQPVTAQNGGGQGAAQSQQINGAGATFPYPIYSKWFAEYNKVHPNIQINYQSIGSGGGIQQFTAGTVDFGATDAPMSDAEQARAADAVHIPTVLGAVVVTYNAPIQGLRLTPAVLSHALFTWSLIELPLWLPASG